MEEELLKPAIRGVRLLFEAANAEHKVKRIVMTSSFASVLDVSRGPGPGFTYTGEDWNPLTYEESVKANPIIAYRGSKKFAEVEAWNFVNGNQVSFDLVTLCPPMTFGPVVHPLDYVEDLNVSNAALWDVYKGVNPLPQSRVPVFVDVRDLALAHVKCLIIDKAGDKRYVPSSPQKFSYKLAAHILLKHGLGHNIGDIDDETVVGYDLDYKALESDLGMKFRDFETCVLDSIKQFIELPSRSD